MSVAQNELDFDPAVSFARQSLYRFASLALLDPRFGSWPKLAALREDEVLPEAATILRELPSAADFILAQGERPPEALNPSLVLAHLPSSPELLNRCYEDTFGLLVSNACPPYEMEYIPEKFTFQRSNALADISGFYKAFGFAPSRQHPERPDHIVLELEFMALLIGLERRARTNLPTEGAEHQAICRAAQQRFLREHLAWWAPAFARLLERESQEPCFAAIGQLLSALIPVERMFLGVAPGPQLPAPSGAERPEMCEGCDAGVL